MGGRARPCGGGLRSAPMTELVAHVRPAAGEPEGALVVAIYNWSASARIQELAFHDLSAGPGPFRLRDLWSPRRGGRSLGVHRGAVRLALRPHSVRLLRMEAVAASIS